MDVQVRTADLTDPEDGQAIVALTDAYAQDPMGGGEPLPAETRANLVEAMRAHGKITVLLAEVDDAPVGICTLIESFSAFNAAPVVNIHDLGVLPEHRDQGIGQALLAEAEALARELGACRLSLEALPDNPAIRLYKRLGFRYKNDYMIKSLGEDRVA